MPSGAKKRKAAKKKKEKGASNSHEPGDGDLKLSSPISEHNDDESKIDKNKKDPSSVPSANENVNKTGEAIEKVGKSSSSKSSSSRSRSSSSSGGSSSDDESLNSVEKNVVIIESNDPFLAETPSHLPQLLNEEDAAILEDKKLEVLPIEDHNEMDKENNSSADLQIDLVQVKEEVEACNHSVIDPPSTSVNQEKKVSLVEEEMGEEKYVVLEENTANIIVEPKLEIDQLVSNTIVTSFQEHKGKDYQPTSIAESVENQEKGNSPPKVLQRTSWASCCGLFELFSGTNR